MISQIKPEWRNQWKSIFQQHPLTVRDKQHHLQDIETCYLHLERRKVLIKLPFGPGFLLHSVTRDSIFLGFRAIHISNHNMPEAIKLPEWVGLLISDMITFLIQQCSKNICYYYLWVDSLALKSFFLSPDFLLKHTKDSLKISVIFYFFTQCLSILFQRKKKKWWPF